MYWLAFANRSFGKEGTTNEKMLLSDLPVVTLNDEPGRAEPIVGATPGQVFLEGISK